MWIRLWFTRLHSDMNVFSQSTQPNGLSPHQYASYAFLDHINLQNFGHIPDTDGACMTLGRLPDRRHLMFHSHMLNKLIFVFQLHSTQNTHSKLCCVPSLHLTLLTFLFMLHFHIFIKIIFSRKHHSFEFIRDTGTPILLSTCLCPSPITIQDPGHL